MSEDARELTVAEFAPGQILKAAHAAHPDSRGLGQAPRPLAHLTYVVVTPARNEEQNIRRTLESMRAQTRPPLRWVIVSDGSTDATDEIVNEYRAGYPWIELLRMPETRDRSFAAKVQCFDAGFARVKDLPFDIVASLDADIAFEADYFEFLLGKLEATPKLGVIGTPFVEGDKHYDFRFSNIEHVSGACQVFRRACYEEIGGYVPIKGGGIDWTAVTTARMMGWQTRTFTEKACVHLQPMGSRTGRRFGIVGVNFHHGQRDYYLGGHWLWQIFRCAHQLRGRPYVMGGLSLLAGYIWAALRRVNRPVSPELMTFHRGEQMARLRKLLRTGTTRTRTQKEGSTT